MLCIDKTRGNVESRIKIRIMKAKITKVTFKEERNGKFGMQYNFEIEYDGKKAYYTSKSKDQKKFIQGQECEFDEEKRTSKAGNPYLVVKPIYDQQGKSNYGKALQREQSKYSGFACSYVKDLIVSGHIELDDWAGMSSMIFEHMVELDRSIKS